MSQLTEDQLAHQATIISRYLIGETPADKVKELYAHSLRVNPVTVSKKDQKLLTFVSRHPWSIGYIDAGLSIVNTDSEIRRRVYVLFSILEAMPQYADHFLPKQRSWWYLAVIAGTGVRGVLRTLCGVLLVKVVA